METLNRYAKNTLIWLIKAYRYLLSPWLGNHCRFYPSCSAYAQEAIEMHGVFCGLKLATLRLCKCHPWHPGGEDPVPPRLSSPVSHSTSDLR